MQKQRCGKLWCQFAYDSRYAQRNGHETKYGQVGPISIEGTYIPLNFFVESLFINTNSNSFRNMELQRPQMQQWTKWQRNRYLLFIKVFTLFQIPNPHFLKMVLLLLFTSKQALD